MIRTLEIADAEAVAAIARRARTGAIPHFPDLHSPAEDLAFYRGEIDSKSGWAWVDEPGRIVGFVIRRDAFIDHLYVDPERQRSGIGTELLDRAVAEIDGPRGPAVDLPGECSRRRLLRAQRVPDPRGH